jgi:hypothetical protein
MPDLTTLTREEYCKLTDDFYNVGYRNATVSAKRRTIEVMREALEIMQYMAKESDSAKREAMISQWRKKIKEAK